MTKKKMKKFIKTLKKENDILTDAVLNQNYTIEQAIKKDDDLVNILNDRVLIINEMKTENKILRGALKQSENAHTYKNNVITYLESRGK